MINLLNGLIMLCQLLLLLSCNCNFLLLKTMKPGTKNSYNSLTNIMVGNKNYKYYSLNIAEKNGLEGISKLPKSLKVLLENLLRYEDDLSVNKNQIDSIKELA